MRCPSLWLAITCIVAVIVSPTTTTNTDDDFCQTFCPANSSNIPSASPTESPMKLEAPGDCKKIVCHYWSSSKVKGYGYFGIDDIDPSLCSHIIFSYATLKGTHIVPVLDDDESTPSKKGNYEKVLELKKINPSLKVLLQVGYDNDKPLTAMIARFETRQGFIGNAVAFLRKRGFDGIHLTFRKPCSDGSPPADKHNFALLCQELRKRIDSEAHSINSRKLLMTADVNHDDWYRLHAYDIPALNVALDFIVLPLCGFHGYQDGITKHPSPLYKGSFENDGNDYNVDAMVNKWENAGLYRPKLVVSLGFYSRTYKLDSTDNIDVLAPAHGKPCIGPYSRSRGLLAYYEVCQWIDAGAEKRYIFSQKVPYLVSGDNWIGYDDDKSLREKVRYVKENDLGGIHVASINLDDFSGFFCNAGKYPLLTAINEECSEP